MGRSTEGARGRETGGDRPPQYDTPLLVFGLRPPGPSSARAGAGTPHAPRPKHGFTLVEVMLGASIMAITMVALMGAFFGQSFLNTTARNVTAAMNDASRVMEQIRQQNTGCAVPSIAPPVGFASWDAWLNTGGLGAPKSINQTNRDAMELIVVSCQDGSVSTCQAGATVTCQGGSTVTCPAGVGATVACPDGTRFGSIPPYCGTAAGAGTPAQVGTGEWGKAGGSTTFNPIRITVSVGWAQGERAMGGTAAGSEFTYTGSATQCNSVGGCAPVCTTTPPTFTIGPDRNGNGVIESQAMLTTLVTCR